MPQVFKLGSYWVYHFLARRPHVSLVWYCRQFRINLLHADDIFKIANARCGLYAQANGDAINYILNPKVLSTKVVSKEKGTLFHGLLDPYAYYMNIKSDFVLHIM